MQMFKTFRRYTHTNFRKYEFNDMKWRGNDKEFEFSSSQAELSYPLHR